MNSFPGISITRSIPVIVNYFERSGKIPASQNYHNTSNLIQVPLHSSYNTSRFDLQLYYQNVRGLRSKVDQVFFGAQSDESDIYCFTETWLNESFNNNELFPHNFQVYRSDNQSALSNKSRGGGVLIALTNNLITLGSPVPYNTRLTDALLIRVKNLNVTFLLCVVYISPSSPLAEYQSFYNFIDAHHNANSNTKLIICGDFNIPNLNSGQTSATLDNFILFYDLTQFNKTFNHFNKTLDLVLSNFNLKVTRYLSPLVPEDSHHPTLCVTFQLNRCFSNKDTTASSFQNFTYDYSKANYYQLYQDMSRIDFNNVIMESDVDKATNNFYEHVYKCINNNIPRKTVSFDAKYPSWYTKSIIKKIKTKKSLIKKFRKRKNNNSNTINLEMRIRLLRKEIKTDLKKIIKNMRKILNNYLQWTPKKFGNLLPIG